MLNRLFQTEKNFYGRATMRLLICFILLFSSSIFFAQTPEETAKKLTDLYGLAHIKEEKITKELEALKNQLQNTEENLKDLSDDKDIPSEALKAKKKTLNQLIQKQKTLLVEQRDNKKLLSKIGDLINQDTEKQSKFVADYEEKYGVIDLPKTSVYDEVLAPATPKTEEVIVSSKNSMTKMESSEVTNEVLPIEEVATTDYDTEKLKKKRKNKIDSEKKVSEKKVALEYDEKNDVMFHPPIPPCHTAFDSTDTFTGKRKKESAPILFFTQTDDVLKKMMKDKEFITCYITATRIEGGLSFLNLNFIIQSKETQKIFGFLDKGSPISFRLINGHTLNFTNSKTDIGTVDFLKNTTTFQASIQLYGNDIKALTASELDQVRMAWSAGSDDYEIYDVNVLKNLLKCLN